MEIAGLKNVTANRTGRWQIFCGAVALVITSATPVLIGWYEPCSSSEDIQGLVLVPFLVGVVLYKFRGDFTRVEVTICKPAGFAAAIAFGLMHWANYAGYVRFACLLLVTLGLLCLGWLGTRAANLFCGPLCLLACMIPPPDWIIDFVTWALQHLQSNVLDLLLPLMARDYVRDGFAFLFEGINRTLTVGKECSGIRSLLGIIVMAVSFSVFDRATLWKAVLFVVSACGIAICLNFVRVVVAVQLRINSHEEYAVGAWHGYQDIAVFFIGVMFLNKLSAVFKRR